LRTSARGSPVRFDEIMEALRTLDKLANGHPYRNTARRRRILRRDRGTGQTGGTAVQ
jgi:hypothetical protein